MAQQLHDRHLSAVAQHESELLLCHSLTVIPSPSAVAAQPSVASAPAGGMRCSKGKQHEAQRRVVDNSRRSAVTHSLVDRFCEHVW